MFVGRQMVHQQVDLAFSQFPKGLAAELASDQAHPLWSLTDERQSSRSKGAQPGGLR
jgi:hypothetical protein